MATTRHSHTASSVKATGAYDGRIIAGYCLLAAIALAALYFASSGPGTGDAAIAVMVAMP